MSTMSNDEFRAAVAAARRDSATAQTELAATNTRLERMLTSVEALITAQGATGAGASSPASLSAPNASSSAGTLPDGTPTETSHGSHAPARADTFDMLHREKNLLGKITTQRLEPFSQDPVDQIEV